MPNKNSQRDCACSADHSQAEKGKSSAFNAYLGCSVRKQKTSINFLWKNNSSLLIDENGKLIKSREAIPLTARGVDIVGNLSGWKKINPNCKVNLWIDGKDSFYDGLKVTMNKLSNFDIRVHDLRENNIFKSSVLSKYLGQDENSDFGSDNLFDHLIQCRMNWETIDLLKILVLLESLSCGIETAVFSDLDITPFSINEKLTGDDYGESLSDLLDKYSFLVASALIANGKVVPANNFFVFKCAGLEKLTAWFENSVRMALDGKGNAFRCLEESLVSLESKQLSLSYSSSDKRVLSKIPLIDIGELQGQKK